MRSFRSGWPDSVVRLAEVGFTTEDAYALRRISMTLHRWHEMECGDSSPYCSYVIARGFKPEHDGMGARLDGGPNDEKFIHDDNGKPFLEMHYNDGRVRHEPMADRERGALKRLAAIMARYPGFEPYVQGDPRGAALYIMTPGEMASREPGWLEANYNRGIAVYK